MAKETEAKRNNITFPKLHRKKCVAFKIYIV